VNAVGVGDADDEKPPKVGVAGLSPVVAAGAAPLTPSFEPNEEKLNPPLEFD